MVKLRRLLTGDVVLTLCASTGWIGGAVMLRYTAQISTTDLVEILKLSSEVQYFGTEDRRVVPLVPVSRTLTA